MTDTATATAIARRIARIAARDAAFHSRQATRTCAECSRVFDLLDDTDAQEWYYGHDCE